MIEYNRAGKVGEGTHLEMLSSVKSNLNLEDRMSKMLKILYSKPQDCTYFLLLAFAKQCIEGDDNRYTVLHNFKLNTLVRNVCLEMLCSVSMAHCHFLFFYNLLFFYIYKKIIYFVYTYKNYVLCICQ